MAGEQNGFALAFLAPDPYQGTGPAAAHILYAAGKAFFFKFLFEAPEHLFHILRLAHITLHVDKLFPKLQHGRVVFFQKCADLFHLCHVALPLSLLYTAFEDFSSGENPIFLILRRIHPPWK